MDGNESQTRTVAENNNKKTEGGQSFQKFTMKHLTRIVAVYRWWSNYKKKHPLFLPL